MVDLVTREAFTALANLVKELDARLTDLENHCYRRNGNEQ